MAILNTFELLRHLVEIHESFTWHIASHQYDVIPRMSCLVENEKWVETQIEETSRLLKRRVWPTVFSLNMLWHVNPKVYNIGR